MLKNIEGEKQPLEMCGGSVNIGKVTCVEWWGKQSKEVLVSLVSCEGSLSR